MTQKILPLLHRSFVVCLKYILAKDCSSRSSFLNLKREVEICSKFQLGTLFLSQVLALYNPLPSPDNNTHPFSTLATLSRLQAAPCHDSIRLDAYGSTTPYDDHLIKRKKNMTPLGTRETYKRIEKYKISYKWKYYLEL